MSWEEKYHELYQVLKEERIKTKKQDGKEKARFEVHRQEIQSLHEALKSLSDEIKLKDSQLKDSLQEKISITKAHMDMEQSLLVAQTRMASAEQEIVHLKEQLRQGEDAHEYEKKALEEEVDKLNEEVVSLEERNNELKETIDSIKDETLKVTVREENNQDIVFAKFLETCPGDESNIRQLFQDSVSLTSNTAFQMLVQLCYDDMTGCFPDLGLLGIQDMLEIVVKKELFLRFSKYAKVLLNKNNSLFYETSASSKKMTRHEMTYEEQEVVSARHQFTMAFFSALCAIEEESKEFVPKKRKVGEEEDIPKKKKTRTKSLGFFEEETDEDT